MEADGWLITHDPLTLKYGEHTNLYVDLGAETPLAAEKEERKIAVEIKSFLSPSPLSEMEKALGQFGLYRFLLARQFPGRILYLALPESRYEALFDTETERIVRWIE
ncbi:element excision factor XisH family protein [Armatimonas sp.]|uniref:element excision factor XisH family protein n=1 Tax=Armatimonas sp. TaxID=1872638 RepID=UPI003751E5A6